MNPQELKQVLAHGVNNVFDKPYATTGFAGTPTFRGAGIDGGQCRRADLGAGA